MGRDGWAPSPVRKVKAPEKKARVLVVAHDLMMNPAMEAALAKKVELWWNDGGVMLVDRNVDEILKVYDDGTIDVIYSKHVDLTKVVVRRG